MIVLLIFSAVFYAGPISASSLRMTVGQQVLSDEFGPVFTDEGLAIPIELAALFGAEVSRDGSRYTIEHEGRSTSLRAGDTIASHPTGSQKLTAPPVAFGGTLYVPVRFFADMLGLKMTWDLEANALDLSPWSLMARESRRPLLAYETIDQALDAIDAVRAQIAAANGTADGSAPVRAELYVHEPSTSSPPQTAESLLASQGNIDTLERSSREIAAAIARLLGTDDPGSVLESIDLAVDGSTDRGETATLWRDWADETGLVVGSERDAHRFTLTTMEDAVFSAFLLEDPDRLVIDVDGLPGYSGGILSLDDPLVEAIRTANYLGGLRLIFDLRAGIGYRLTQEDPRRAVVSLNRPLTAVELTYGPGGGHMRLDVDGSTPHEVTRLSDPDRWIVDLLDTTVLLEEKAMTLPEGPVRQIRIAQFLPDVARMVLDLDEDIGIEVEEDSEGLAVYFGNRVSPVVYRAVGDRGLEIGFAFDSVSKPVIQRLSGPDRFVVDVPGARWLDSTAEHVFMDGPVSRLRVSQHDEDTVRIVADLRYHVQHAVTEGDKRTIVALKRPSLLDRDIVVDAGHGGIDPGAIGRRTGLMEKDVTLDIALRLAALIDDADGTAHLTRVDDAYPDLWSRPQSANELGADVFLSIHVNGADTSSATANGTEVYVKTDEPDSLYLGEQILDGLVSALGTRDRGVRENRYLVVRNADMPAALIEVAFLSHEVEEELLGQEWYRQRAAEAIFNGLLAYFHRDDALDEGVRMTDAEATTEWQRAGRGIRE